MIIPATRPKMSQERVLELLPHPESQSVFLVGMRGYYRDQMGDVGRNDLNVYDDAIFLVSPDVFVSYNANCDPSVVRPRVATLLPGRYLYQIGKHKGEYTALIQASAVTVRRFPRGAEQPIVEQGWFGINIHRGSRTTTSSLGCQTIFPTQWDAFIALVQSELRRNRQRTLPYILLEQQG